jgi:hypothetical protein
VTTVNHRPARYQLDWDYGQALPNRPSSLATTLSGRDGEFNRPHKIET